MLLLKMPLYILMFITTSCINVAEEKNSTLNEPLKDLSTELFFENQVIDFGEIDQDTTLVASFVFKNCGSNQLTIKDVRPDCTCTGYEITDSIIEINKTGTIRLVFNTIGKVGKQVIMATIEANTYDKFYLLKLKCDIRAKPKL